MNILRALTLKLGKPTPHKGGKELSFPCPKCGGPKFDVNISKGVFNCFSGKCGYKGKLSELIEGWNRQTYRETLPTQLSEATTQKCEIPGFRPMPTQAGEEYLRKRGIVGRFACGSSIHLELRGRLVIPIIEEGHIVSYTARAIDGRKPKDIAGPDKGQYLYGLDDVVADDTVVIVEGVFDCEAVKRAGYKSVALLGTNLTDVQLGKLLAKKPGVIVLLFDGDDAGCIGMQKALKKIIRRTHTEAYAQIMPPDKDPDDLSPEELRELLEL